MSEIITDDRPGTLEDAKKLGLSDEEFELICGKLERTPCFTELAMFSGMWSEHCSYKNSILLLKNLYCESDRLLAERGAENAGALRINEKQAVVFKIESHNHPSAIEPYQGAATGVGGIMRDVFTMGARPLATLNSLRFGMPENPRNRRLLREVVKGIGDYGNSLGIPCSGGEIYFHDSYTANPLVNAMTVGIAEIDELASSSAAGPGNMVLYVGARTGRDGIHGASFASKELSQESEEERSAVQVGDPFLEKLVMEATLECIRRKLVIAVQDMGAAGLLSSSSEMSSAGNVGMDLFLDKVPAREKGMLPFEYLLSESQERMLMVIEPSRFSEISAIFEKWELECAEIGVITDSGNLRIFHHGKLYADINAHFLTVNSNGAPRYRRETKKPEPKQDTTPNSGPEKNDIFQDASLAFDPQHAEEVLINFMGHPNIASKRAVYEQYDTDIGNMRVIGPGQNAGVYRVPGTNQAIAMCVDGNSRYVSIDPYSGAAHTVAESYRNLISSGSMPIGITNCLNFANPYKPENYYYFEQAVTGMSDAAEMLNLPITGGNVSFYNESEAGPVLPTPTIGMVGIMEDWKKALGAATKAGNSIFVFGEFNPSLSASEYHHFQKGVYGNQLPELNLTQDKEIGLSLLQFHEAGILSSAIDISTGGIVTALLRVIFAAPEKEPVNGFEFSTPDLLTFLSKHGPAQKRPDTLLFGESAHSYLIGTDKHHEEEVLKIAKEKKIPCFRLGTVTNSSSLSFSENKDSGVSLNRVFTAYRDSLGSYLS